MEAPTDFEAIAGKLDAFLKPESDGRQARTRRRILHAATELFVAYGYRKTSIEDVAGAAGVAKGTVYIYYRSKAELLLHAIALQKQQYLRELAPVFDPSLSPMDRLRTLILLGITLSHQMPLMNRSTSGDHEIEQVLQDVDDQTLTQINEMQVDYVAGLIDAATDRAWSRESLEERAEVLIDLIFAVVNGGRLIRKGMPLDEYATVLADVIVGGIVEPTARLTGMRDDSAIRH